MSSPQGPIASPASPSKSAAPATGAPAARPISGAPGAAAPPERAAYVFIEPLVKGRVVLDVASPVPGAVDLLKEAGAKSVSVLPGGPKLDAPDGLFEVVLCLGKLSESGDDVMRHRWLAELARVVHASGCCVVRVNSRQGKPSQDAPPGLSRAELDDLLRFHFTTVDIVAETRFGGVGFSVANVDAVAVSENVANLGDSCDHHLAFCGKIRERGWSLRESLWVPLGGLPAPAAAVPKVEASAVEQELGRLRARYHEVCVERDYLRETMMTSQDQRDQREDRLSALRREAERHLQQISDDAAALELAGLDRERSERRVAEAEAAMAAIAGELKQREADILSLENEVAQLKKASRRPAPGK